VFKEIVLLTICLSSFGCESQLSEEENHQNYHVEPKTFISGLASNLQENSGIIIYDYLLWTFNDSGGKNVLYGINFEGKIESEIYIEDAINRDWEDITQDDQFIYIGDFGNNNGVRQDLTVYKIDKKEITKDSVQSVQADKIQFKYHNQHNFDYDPLNTEFDCEAIAHLNGELYIFTKDWKNEKTQVYRLPKEKGSYELEPIDSFQVGMLVTGADFSADLSTLALLGYHNFKPIIWIFEDVHNQQVFGTHQYAIRIDSLDRAQTEGICFLNNKSLLISCESTFEHQAQVFEIKLNEFLENGALSD